MFFAKYLSTLLLVGGCIQVGSSYGFDREATTETRVKLVVMDPLCDRLACDCVEGYAQRKYEVLAQSLKQRLNKPVDLFWGESVRAALEETPDAIPDIIIGKHSVVASHAKTLKLKLLPIAQLTGSDGGVTQTGLIVVRKDDDATDVSELKGYRIFFGPADCDEKHAAPIKLLRESGIQIPVKPEIYGACSQAATKLMELESGTKAAAVISSYAEPLLAGCGTIQKGDLRIIGESDDVAFVSVFINSNLESHDQKQIREAILDSGKDTALLKALQSSKGFVPFNKKYLPIATGRNYGQPAGTSEKKN